MLETLINPGYACEGYAVKARQDVQDLLVSLACRPAWPAPAAWSARDTFTALFHMSSSVWETFGQDSAQSPFPGQLPADQNHTGTHKRKGPRLRALDQIQISKAVRSAASLIQPGGLPRPVHVAPVDGSRYLATPVPAGDLRLPVANTSSWVNWNCWTSSRTLAMAPPFSALRTSAMRASISAFC